MLSDENLRIVSDSRKIGAGDSRVLFALRHILTGVGFATVAAVAVANGWVLGTPQATEAREVEAPPDGTITGAPDASPASLIQPAGRNAEKELPTGTPTA